MKTAVWVGAVILFGIQFSFAKQPKPEDGFPFTVTMAGQGDSYKAPTHFPGMQGSFGGGEQTLCWLHVSDGQTLYVAYREIPSVRRLWEGCGTFGVGTQLRGGVSNDRTRLGLFIPDKKGKLKLLYYKITQMANAA